MASLTAVSGQNVAHYDGGACLNSEGREVSWMEGLTSKETGFFRTCPQCAGAGREVMVNFFCLDCADPTGFCSKCTHKHEGHRCLQVRRSSYHDVVRVADLQQVIDVSGIQTYMINSSKVIFIKQRPQPRPSHMAVTCECCGRQLQDARFCSLRCKLEMTDLAPSQDGSSRGTSRPVICKPGKRTPKPQPIQQPSSPDSVEAPDTPSNSEPNVDILDLSTDDAQSQRRHSITGFQPLNHSLRNGNNRKRKRPHRSPLQ